jgi:T5SS/PEP-CTERM-associated repeat protein
MAAAVGLLAFTASGRAAVTSNWQNATGLNNNFSTPDNWDNTHAPVDGDTAVFGSSDTYTVSFGGDATTSAFQVTSGKVTFDLGTHKYTQTATYTEDPPVAGAVIGNASGDNASLTILNGTLSSGSVSSDRRVIGNAAGSTGKLTVSTGGILSGTGRYIFVGNSGDGTLEVINGGQINNVYSYIAAASGSVGHVLIDGDGSKWSMSSTPYIAHAANSKADILVRNKGILYTGTALIADATGAEAEITITGSGSKWQAGSNTSFGTVGTATVNVLDGGAINANGSNRNFRVHANGVVNLQGSGTFDFGAQTISFIGGTLNVTGLSNILKGGEVTFDDDAHINITLTADGVNSADSSLHLGTELTLGANGIDVALENGFTPVAGDSFKLLSWDSSPNWTLDPSLIHLPGLDGGMYWDTSNLVSGGTISVVPEPATAALVGIILAGGMFRRRRGS